MVSSFNGCPNQLQKYPGGHIIIYFGTQTGTAESFAQQLEREGEDHGFAISVVDMEDTTESGSLSYFMEDSPFGEKDGSSPRAIFLTSTYGEGDPTDNANALVKLCKKTLEEKPESKVLQGLEFCVFGLGNKEYEHYNAMGKFFDAAFSTLGATRIMPLGLGDDDADLEGDFETWKDQMWKCLKDRYLKGVSLPTHKVDEDSAKLPECEYVVEYLEKGTPLANVQDFSADQVHGSCRPFFSAVDCPVTVNRELRSAKDRGSTKHVEIDISKTDLSYNTADNLGVLPLNDPKVVESVAASLGYDLDAVFVVRGAPNHEWHGAPFPTPCTVRECLTRYLDLTSGPRRSDLKLLSQYATDKLDRQALLRLSSKEGKQEYKDKITKHYVGLVQLFDMCKSLKIPLEHLITICHFQMPRFYTISSSSSLHPKSVHLTVALTEHERPKGGPMFRGVCSNHLASADPSSSMVRVLIRPSTFRLPEDPSRPILMIGPGTGIAPMRALLQERKFQKEQQNLPVGKNVLYFGCKKSHLDYLYQSELEAYEAEGILDELRLAFSREQITKVYVQHLLLENAEETYQLIQKEQGSIYVCGAVRMGQDVLQALQEIWVEKGEMSFPEAKDALAKLSSSGRFIQELWA
eukprot:Nitzschia sp. Nitz4//scaffold176_size46146//23793//25694//NITZ4_007192-RA/size46146-processed-gene-0.34-mRNA-1//-1//CDS//3329539015//7809//frame0